jgi:hypothetical protein
LFRDAIIVAAGIPLLIGGAIAVGALFIGAASVVLFRKMHTLLRP